MKDNSSEKVQIALLLRTWFKKITDHAPVTELLELLASDGFEMKFPEALLQNQNDFKVWYENVTRKFFDQVHDTRNFHITVDGDEGIIVVYVTWQAHVWEPPQAYSTLLNFDAIQTWRVVRQGNEGKWKIKRYIVETLENNE